MPPVTLDIAQIPTCTDEPTLGLPSVNFERRNYDEPTVTGSVVRSPGPLPTVPGVKVVLADRDHHTVMGQTRTDRNGYFEFRDVSPGWYKLTASLTGYADFVVNNIEVRAGKTTKIVPPLEMEQCPIGLHCTPSDKVRVPVICL